MDLCASACTTCCADQLVDECLPCPALPRPAPPCPAPPCPALPRPAPPCLGGAGRGRAGQGGAGRGSTTSCASWQLPAQVQAHSSTCQNLSTSCHFLALFFSFIFLSKANLLTSLIFSIFVAIATKIEKISTSF